MDEPGLLTWFFEALEKINIGTLFVIGFLSWVAYQAYKMLFDDEDDWLRTFAGSSVQENTGSSFWESYSSVRIVAIKSLGSTFHLDHNGLFNICFVSSASEGNHHSFCWLVEYGCVFNVIVSSVAHFRLEGIKSAERIPKLKKWLLSKHGHDMYAIGVQVGTLIEVKMLNINLHNYRDVTTR